MLSTMNLPVRISPQKPTQKRQRSESSSSLPSSLGGIDDIPFGGWSDSDNDSNDSNNSDGSLEIGDEDGAPPAVPPLGRIFATHEEMVLYAKEWTLSYGYTLVTGRTTKGKDDELNRIYLRCDRGGKPKAGQKQTRLVDCQYQLAGHLRSNGWVLSCDKSKGNFI